VCSKLEAYKFVFVKTSCLQHKLKYIYNFSQVVLFKTYPSLILSMYMWNSSTSVKIKLDLVLFMYMSKF
jgi:hypothetical protein